MKQASGKDIAENNSVAQSLSKNAAQLKQANAPASGINFTVQRQENKTGMPDQLKSGIESLSGISMNDVKVHYNSSKPAQLNAHAYAQGTNIHVASGQEKHLPHEAWHVVQQKQGRVQPTTQMHGVNINDNKGLETEADMMGAKAVQMKVQAINTNFSMNPVGKIVQRLEIRDAKVKKTDGNLPGSNGNYKMVNPDGISTVNHPVHTTSSLTLGNATGDVGVGMKAFLYKPKHGSGPAPSALAKLMNKLETASDQKPTSKYIRGHLLNDHLGGEGRFYNLFPITAAANAAHSGGAEEIIKGSIFNSYAAYYKVGITDISTASFVNSDLWRVNSKINAQWDIYGDGGAHADGGGIRKLDKIDRLSGNITIPSTYVYREEMADLTGRRDVTPRLDDASFTRLKKHVLPRDTDFARAARDAGRPKVDRDRFLNKLRDSITFLTNNGRGEAWNAKARETLQRLFTQTHDTFSLTEDRQETNLDVIAENVSRVNLNQVPQTPVRGARGGRGRGGSSRGGGGRSSNNSSFVSSSPSPSPGRGRGSRGGSSRGGRRLFH